MARCAVRATFSGATGVVERCTAHVPPALRGRDGAARHPYHYYSQLAFTHLSVTFFGSRLAKIRRDTFTLIYGNSKRSSPRNGDQL
jgi:hypothetical protein